MGVYSKLRFEKCCWVVVKLIKLSYLVEKKRCILNNITSLPAASLPEYKMSSRA